MLNSSEISKNSVRLKKEHNVNNSDMKQNMTLTALL